MAGTRAGGVKAAATNKARYGDDWYKNIGRKGGQAGCTGGFASNKVGEDGMSGHERSRAAGSKGGARSKRGYKLIGETKDRLIYLNLSTNKEVSFAKK